MLIDAIKTTLGALARQPHKFGKIFTRAGFQTFMQMVRRQPKTAAYAAKIAAERRLSFEQGNWNHAQGVSQRRYESYESYVAHQKSKLEDFFKDGINFDRSDRWLDMFRRRFELVGELRKPATVLCLAARNGAEVQSLIGLGHFAIGIDLNPGPGNPYVVTGDFHALVFGEATVDAVYTNSLDHAFDLARVTAEVRRVLKPGGLFILDAVSGYEEGYTVGDHDCMHWPTARGFAEQVAEAGGFSVRRGTNLTPHGSKDFWQFILMKAAPG